MSFSASHGWLKNDAPTWPPLESRTIARDERPSAPQGPRASADYSTLDRDFTLGAAELRDRHLVDRALVATWSVEEQVAHRLDAERAQPLRERCTDAGQREHVECVEPLRRRPAARPRPLVLDHACKTRVHSGHCRHLDASMDPDRMASLQDAVGRIAHDRVDAARRRATQLDRSAVQLDQAPCDRQPEARSRRLRRAPEPVEGALALLGGETRRLRRSRAAGRRARRRRSWRPAVRRRGRSRAGCRAPVRRDPLAPARSRRRRAPRASRPARLRAPTTGRRAGPRRHRAAGRRWRRSRRRRARARAARRRAPPAARPRRAPPPSLRSRAAAAGPSKASAARATRRRRTAPATAAASRASPSFD